MDTLVEVKVWEPFPKCFSERIRHSPPQDLSEFIFSKVVRDILAIVQREGSLLEVKVMPHGIYMEVGDDTPNAVRTIHEALRRYARTFS